MITSRRNGLIRQVFDDLFPGHRKHFDFFGVFLPASALGSSGETDTGRRPLFAWF